MCKVRRMDINCWQSCSGSEKGHTVTILYQLMIDTLC